MCKFNRRVWGISKTLILTAILICSVKVTVFSQTKFIQNVFLQRIHVNTYNSIGFSNIVTSHISEIASANPASLSDYNSPSAGINFSFSSRLNYYYGIKIEGAKEWLPSSVGMVYPMNNFNIGLGYYQKYSNYMDFGRTEITTILEPEGTGEYWEASEETIIHSPSILLSYSWKNLFLKNDRLSLGGQVFWDWWLEENKIYKTTATVNANCINWKLGFIYKFRNDIGIGMCFEKGIDMEGEIEVTPEFLVESDPMDSSGYYSGTQVKNILVFKLPDRLSFGIAAKSGNDFTLATTLSAVFWSSVDDRFQDQLDYSANFIYSLMNNFDLSFGVYATDRILKDDFSYGNYSKSATFFDLGFKFKYDKIGILAELMDSRLFSAEMMKQTIFTLGISCKLNHK